MGSSRRRLGVIAAAMVIFSLLSAGDGNGDGNGDGYWDDYEDAVQYYMDCLAMYERHDRGDYISPEDSFGCGRSLDSVRDAYGAIGRLWPEYAEALKRYFNGNQTLIDMEICSLDDVRSRENIRCATLPKKFVDDKFFQEDHCWFSW